ncbi:MAG: FHA domain-containing serine/threonine-protein kinase [Lachnospirales bacterium]
MKNSDFCHNCFSEITDSKCEKCGYISVENDDNIAIVPGTLLNNMYKVGRVLGVGGFGITYKAQNIKTGDIVTIKEYVPVNIAYRDFSDNSVNVKSSKFSEIFNDGLISFIQEANFLVMLKNNKNIVEIYDCFNENNTAYYTMEFLDGYTFKEIGSSNYTLAYESMVKVAKALRVVHKKGIVHRDISPQNIFLLKNSDIMLIDFGNARYFNKANQNDSSLVLKPGFSPPELYMKENVQGPWTDIYSLAATFYSMVTGKCIPNALERIDGMPVESIRKYVPKISYGLEQAINHALELDYVRRTQDIDGFLDEIANPVAVNSVQTRIFLDTEGEKDYVQAMPNNSIVHNPYKNIDKKVVPQRKEVKKNHKTEIDRNSINHKRNNGKRDKFSKNSGGSAFDRKFLRDKHTIDNNKFRKNAYVVGYNGRQYAISDIRDIVVGRNASTSHIIIQDANVSRKHCVIEYNSAEEKFYIVDWSSNGTYLKGNVKLKYGVRYVLKPGDSFFVYKPEYEFKVVIK